MTVKRAVIFLIGLLVILQSSIAQEKSTFKDTLDGSFDASNFLLSVSGFLPIPTIITEPAVGYGGGLMGAYFHKKKNAESTIAKPDISIAGGAFTENGTWMVGGGHIGFWKEDMIRYRGFAAYGNLNLSFYPFTEIAPEQELKVELKPIALYQDLSFRLLHSKWYLGGEIIIFSNKVSVKNDRLLDLSYVSSLENTLLNTGVGLSLSYDNRNSLYTPTKGIYFKNNLRSFGEWMGGDTDYMGYQADLMFFHPIVEQHLFLGLRNNLNTNWGGAPFYVLPSIDMRGVKRMRYQGEMVNTTEMELRYQLNYRWSVLGFGGLGTTFTQVSLSDANEAITAGGVGFRYRLARLFGLHAGMDFAMSEKDLITNKNQFAFYITVGSAWRN